MTKLAFATCVELGFSCMKEIYKLNKKIDLAITLNDKIASKKSGRVYLDDFCKQKKIKLLKVDHINEAKCLNTIKSLNIDWLFIIGWSQIANDEVLKSPNIGALGIHPTLLPEGRGRASIPNAILKSLKTTGATLFKLSTEVDSGPILEQIKIPITNKTNAAELYKLTKDAHVQLIRNSLGNIISNDVIFKTQDEKKATYWEGRKPEDGEIQSDKMDIYYAEKLIRATTKPYPGAFCYINDQKVIIWESSIYSRKPPEGKLYLKFTDAYLVFDSYEILS